MEAVSKLLERPLTELIKPDQQVVTLAHNLTVGEALTVLARHGILSAPLVINPDLEEVGSGDFTTSLLGWVDVQDLLNGFLKHMDDVGGTPSHSSMLGWMLALEKHGPEFADKPLVTVTDAQDRALLYTGDGNISVLQAIRNDFFRVVNGETRAVHRLAVFDAHGEITAVVTQMDIACWLLQHGAELGAFAERSLEDLGLLTGRPPVVQVSPNSPTLVAFGAMAAAHVSGAPVVTDEGQLIANLSVSDIRYLTAEHFGVLALPVGEFLALAHNTVYLGYQAGAQGGAPHPFFASSQRLGGPQRGDISLHTVQRTSTLHQALVQMVHNDIHRVYVASSHASGLRAEAVVTLTDVLRLLAGVA